MSEHYSYKTDETIEQYLLRLNEATSLDIPQRVASRHTGQGHLFWRPFAYFFRSLMNPRKKKGARGFIQSAMEAISILISCAKLWEYIQRTRESNAELPPVTQQEIERLRQYR